MDKIKKILRQLDINYIFTIVDDVSTLVVPFKDCDMIIFKDGVYDSHEFHIYEESDGGIVQNYWCTFDGICMKLLKGLV